LAFGIAIRDLALILLGLAGEALEQFLDFAVLLAVAVGPFADHLLLGAHMRDQALNGFGEIGHRRSGVAAGAALFQTLPQPLDRALQFATGAAAHAFSGIFAHR